MAETHFIPADTERNGFDELARCGVWIRRNYHSRLPSCADCRRLIAEDEAADAEIAKGLEAAYPEYRGKLVSR